MHDLRWTGALDRPQDEIVVLRTLEADPETAQRHQKVPPVDGKVTHVVMGPQQIGAEGRLEIGVAAASLRVQLVLVRIEDSRLWKLVDRSGHAGQCVRTQHVVVIKEGDVIAASHFDGGVGGP